jgi:hypothetical protein
MARFKVATADGYEIVVEHRSETPEDFAAGIKDRQIIEATEIIRSSACGSEKRYNIVLCTSWRQGRHSLRRGRRSSSTRCPLTHAPALLLAWR